MDVTSQLTARACDNSVVQTNRSFVDYDVLSVKFWCVLTRFLCTVLIRSQQVVSYCSCSKWTDQIYFIRMNVMYERVRASETTYSGVM